MKRYVLLDMSVQFILIAKIIHNLRLTIIRISVYNYTDRL
jgi:hypothetical protein